MTAANQTLVASSTVSPAALVASSTVEDFFSIDRRRCAAGISVDRLVQSVGVAISTWWRIKKNPATAERRTLRRLAAALDALSCGQAVHSQSAGSDRAIALLLDSRFALLAREAGLDPAIALGQDFSVQKPLNRTWLESAQLRRMAIYWLVIEDGFERVAVGRAAKCTRQNVAQAIQFVEAKLEEEPAIAALLARALGRGIPV